MTRRQISISIAELWQPWRWPARFVIAGFALTQALLAIDFMATSNSNLRTIISILLMAGAFVLLSLHWGPTLPVRIGLMVLVLVGTTMAIEAPTGIADGSSHGDWHLGALVGALMALMLWGRVWLGWLGFAMMVTIQVAVSASEGIGIDVTGPILLRHAATLAIAGFMVYCLRGIAESLRDAAEARRLRQIDERVQATLADVRADQVARLDNVAGDVLRRIASGQPLTAEERIECLLAEAMLRDALSAYALATPEVRAAVADARARGVIVTLLDDSAGANPNAEIAATRLVAVLAELTGGSCTARLLPKGRSEIASIVVEDADGEARVIDVRVGD